MDKENRLCLMRKVIRKYIKSGTSDKIWVKFLNFYILQQDCEDKVHSDMWEDDNLIKETPICRYMYCTQLQSELKMSHVFLSDV